MCKGFMASVHVDSREVSLIECLQRVCGAGTVATSITVTGKQLEVGDVHIVAENGLLLVFERKTGADLTSSIKDGRYREQKRRMAEATAPHHITYIIESKERCTLPQSVLDGMTVNTMYRDGMHIIYTKDIADTAEWILKVARKVAADPGKFMSQTQGGSYIESVKIKSRKIDNIDIRTCYLLQLGQIPGVSSRIAEAIAQIYPTMYGFVKAINECDNPTQDLCKIPLIGDKKAKKIVEYIKV